VFWKLIPTSNSQFLGRRSFHLFEQKQQQQQPAVTPSTSIFRATTTSPKTIASMAEASSPSPDGIPRPASSYASKFKLPEHFYGGNRLDAAPPSKVKDFVASHDGHTVITKVCRY
jgi:hypothetical protein